MFKSDNIVCQECFGEDATMQHDSGTYCCYDCWLKLNEEAKSDDSSPDATREGHHKDQT